MSQVAEIKLRGFEKFEAMLNQLPEDIASKAAIKALKDGAKIVLEEAQSLVPEGATGKLADSLAIKIVKGGLPTYRVYARRKKGFGGWHANIVELGTAPHKIFNVLVKGKFFKEIDHPGSPPQPFMRPALLTKKNEALKAIFGNLMKHITSTVKREMK